MITLSISAVTKASLRAFKHELNNDSAEGLVIGLNLTECVSFLYFEHVLSGSPEQSLLCYQWNKLTHSFVLLHNIKISPIRLTTYKGVRDLIVQGDCCSQHYFDLNYYT